MNKITGILISLLSANCFADTFLIEFTNCSNGVPRCATVYYNITSDIVHSGEMVVAEADPSLSGLQQLEINKQREHFMMPWENGRSLPLKVNGRIESGSSYNTLFMSEILQKM